MRMVVDFRMAMHGPRRGLHGRFRIVDRLHTEHALYPAHDTADHAPHNRADRPGRPVALVHAMRNTARNSLGVRREWKRERGNRGDCNQS